MLTDLNVESAMGLKIAFQFKTNIK